MTPVPPGGADFSIHCPDCGRSPIGLGNPRCPACGYTAGVVGRLMDLGQAASEEDYPEHGAEALARAQDRHFWFPARNAIIVSALRRQLRRAEEVRIAELGCGTGYVMAALERAGWNVVGIDMHAGGLKVAESLTRGSLIRGDLRRIRFVRPLDAVGLFDVIEHLDDDVDALLSAHALLKDDGLLIVSVPAMQSLWSRYDEIVGHKRRYGARMLRSVMEQAGFQPIEVFHAFSFATLPVLVQRLLKDHAGAPKDAGFDAYMVPPAAPLNALFAWASAFERMLRSGGISLPFGTSLIGVARKVG